MTEPVAAEPVSARLVLVRMALPAKKPVAAKTVREDVNRLLEIGLTPGQFDELRGGLAAEGLLAVGKRNAYALTDAGRREALRFLDLDELPPRTTWNAVVNKHLFPRAMGLSAAAAGKLNDGDRPAAFLLRRKYALPPGAGTTLRQVLPALVCKELGFPDETTAEGLMCAVLSRLLGAPRLTAEKLAKQVPLFETGLTSLRADEVRRLLIRERYAAAAAQSPRRSPAAAAAEEFDLEAFVATVSALASAAPSQDRFHGDKVFVAPLWRASLRETSFPRLSAAEFKQRLLEANALRLLNLSRADLVSEMDPALVEASEIRYGNAAFHFVRLEECRS